MTHLPSLRLVGAHVLGVDGLQPRPISLSSGKIAGDTVASGAFAEVDLNGYLVLPGIVDLHGDGYEHHMAPRPSAPFPTAAGLASYDREAAGQGITTAFLAHGWSWEGAQRSPERAEAMMAALAAYRPQALTDLRMQLRAETHLVPETDRLIATVTRYGIGYVVFNDHLAEGLAMAHSAPERFAYWAWKLSLSTDELRARLNAAQAAGPQVASSLERLAEAFDRLGVVYGSHDDPDADTRDRYNALGAKVAEFPLTIPVAAAARAAQCPVVMGAPNVVRGSSQAGNASARDMVAAGCCDVLVSDYHLPALPLAAWTLVDQGVLDLAQAWALISTRPAEVLRLSDRGRLEPGLRADLAVVHRDSRRIEATISNGRLTYLAGEAGARFLSGVTTARAGRQSAEAVAAQ